MPGPFVGTIGEIGLNGFYYWLLASTYMTWRPRLRKATPRTDGAESYVDLGLGKRIWKFTILAANALENYDGTPYYLTAAQITSTLEASYALVNTSMNFLDIDNSSHTVRFDHLARHCPDPKSQTNSNGPSYHTDIELVEV